MTLLRLCLCAAALSFSHCSHSRVPEPAEFKLSTEALGKRFASWRETEAGRLYADKIEVTRDEEGRTIYHGSGGALLLAGTEPLIQAMAPSISVTSGNAEIYGKSVVRKDGRIYAGEDDSATIHLRGGEIKPEGAHAVRGIADAESEPPAETVSPETVNISLALTPTFGTAPPPPPAPSTLPPPAVTEPVKVKPSRPKVASSRPAKPTAVPEAGKPSAPAPAAKPKAKEAPAIDRSNLLNLMREPTER